jgi:ABC-type antimicrobial peptide transport system permease subunit
VILKHGMGLAIMGVVVGILAAFALTHTARSLLFGVTPTDPITFVGVAAVLSAAAFTAGDVPARRAAQVDSLRALRTE